MLVYDDLNPYSRRFAEQLFAAYPEWRARATGEPWPNADAGCFLVEVPSPADPARRLHVTTDGGEITVGFGEHGWHTHFGEWTGADEATSFREALALVAGLLAEEVVVLQAFVDGEARWSQSLAANEAPELCGADRGEVYSWRGTHDRPVFPA